MPGRLTADGSDGSNALVSPRKVHADQVDIDTPLVRELVAAQFPQWAALPLEPVGSSGLVNAVYRLGTDLSVRLPFRPSTTDEVRREQAKLAALAPFLPVAIPSVEAIVRSGGLTCQTGRRRIRASAGRGLRWPRWTSRRGRRSAS
jgi:hypothetical protein